MRKSRQRKKRSPSRRKKRSHSRQRKKSRSPSRQRKKRSPSRRRKKSRSPVRIKIKRKGELTSLGYRMKKSPSERHKALAKAVRKYGYSGVMKKINALYVFNKNQRPYLAKIAQNDKQYLKNYHK